MLWNSNADCLSTGRVIKVVEFVSEYCEKNNERILLIFEIMCAPGLLM